MIPNTSMRLVQCCVLALLCAVQFFAILFLLLRQQEPPMANDFESRRKMPLIFVGGTPSSGTTLMRMMLDAHADIRCGPETHAAQHILQCYLRYTEEPPVLERYEAAGITEGLLRRALGAFILELVEHHGAPAKRLCNKDPLMLVNMWWLANVFPNSKYVLMIRDGRAVVHSLIARYLPGAGFDLMNFTRSMEQWNQFMHIMHGQCMLLGATRCFPMYYEQLVLHPQEAMRQLLRFLDVPWSDAVLSHEKVVGSEVVLSRFEVQAKGIVRPVSTSSLSKWFGKIPVATVSKMAQIAPMLTRLGYDASANPPDYRLMKHVSFWNTSAN